MDLYFFRKTVFVNIAQGFVPILERVCPDVRKISIGILVSTDLPEQQQFTVTPLSGQQMHETKAGGVTPVASEQQVADSASSGAGEYPRRGY